jgi:HD superfamily phosphodiesterase
MLLSKIIKFVIATTVKYNIDESHGLSHSLNTLYYANRIFEREVIKSPFLKPQERLIYISAAIHDMCDKKYMDEQTGIQNVCDYLSSSSTMSRPNKTPILRPYEIEAITRIISTMSYSTVKKNGFPKLYEFQTAYHIVRESDLLTAYDFDRSMVYHMNHRNATLEESYQNARELFLTRVLKHNDDKLFFTDYGREESVRLHNVALQRMSHWNHILSKNLCEIPPTI